MSRPYAAARKFSGRFARNEGGAVIILVGLVIIVLALGAGVAIDAGRGYLLKSRLSGALDAAGLAGGRVMHLANAQRDADINSYFTANMPAGFMGSTVPTLTITTNADNTELTVTASATVNTTLMRLIGFNDMTVAAQAVIKRQVTGLEVVMVLDNTGSMASRGKIGALRDAATTLVDVLYGSEETISNLWVGLVPFVHSVNVGNQHASWLVQADPGPPAYPHVNMPACDADVQNINACQQKLSVAVGGDTTMRAYDVRYYAGAPNYTPANIPWKGCVEARIRPDDGSDINDDPPGVRAFRPYFFPETKAKRRDRRRYPRIDNPWWPTTREVASNGYGPNIGCGQAIQPLTETKSTIITAIDAMQPWFYGGTAIKLGMAWGWRTLSPRWKGLWGGDPTLPLDYDAPLMEKAMIVLTDGVQVFWNRKNFEGPDPGDYTSHGRISWGRLRTGYTGAPITSRSRGEDELDSRLALLCTNVKAAGIKVYTIILQVNNSALQDLFRNCASNPAFFFESPTVDDLQGIFATIANDLAQLRIAE